MPKKLIVGRAFMRVIDVVGYLSMIALLAMMLVTTADVTLRYLFDRPVLGAIELTELLMVTIAALSLSWCTLKSGHIRVDIITSAFSKKTNKRIDVINYFLTAAICAFMVPALIGRYVEGVKLDARTYVLRIPEGPFVLILAFGYFLMFVVLIIHMVKSISGEKE
jgi:TRAP-type C4-dicarboxylate transport system permease small subunit